MGLLKLLGINTKHEGQHAAGGKHAKGKVQPKRLPKGNGNGK